MANFLVNMVLAVFMSKKARRNLTAAVSVGMAGNGKARGAGKGSGGESDREKAIRAMQNQGKDLVTADRAELIRKALEVHKAKQKVFANLKDEDRQKLVAIALKQLMHEGRNG